MKTVAIDQAFQRIVAIRWIHKWPPSHSHNILLTEYLRRSALWAHALHTTALWPFWDIAGSLFPMLEYPKKVLAQLAQYLEQIEPYGDEPGDLAELAVRLPTVVQQTCLWYLPWAMIKNDRKVSSFNLLDPFEPLLRYYERGGLLLEPTKDFVQTIGSSFSKDCHYWTTQSTSLISFDDYSLDQLDSTDD